MSDASTLDYHSPHAEEPRPARSPVSFLVICVTVASLSMLIFLWIEVLNSRAGHILPKHESGQWRVSYIQSEASWRKAQSLATGDSTWQTRTLTPAENAIMQADVRANVANGDFRDLVGTGGLLQYVLVPVLLFASLQLFLRRKAPLHSMIAALSFVLAIVYGIAMLYRSYFSNLGW